jgi:hypothetical protein
MAARTWLGGGTIRVENGDFHIDDCGENCSLGVVDPDSRDWARYTDVSYRVQGRITEGKGFISTWGRSLSPSVYYGAVNSDLLMRIGETVSGPPRNADEASVDFDITQSDVVMKLDLIGDEISFAAWPAGGEHSDLPVTRTFWQSRH